MRLQLDTGLSGTGPTRAGDASQVAPASGPGSNTGRIVGDYSGADSIQISGLSSALSLEAADRSARIDELTALVQSDSYQVASPLVSRAIVQQAAAA